MITALSLLLFALLVVCVVRVATSSDIGYSMWIQQHLQLRKRDAFRVVVACYSTNASCRRQLLELESGIIVS